MDRTLDKSKPYAEVLGQSHYAYEQDGFAFDSKGNQVEKTPPATKSTDQIRTEEEEKAEAKQKFEDTRAEAQRKYDETMAKAQKELEETQAEAQEKLDKEVAAATAKADKEAAAAERRNAPAGSRQRAAADLDDPTGARQERQTTGASGNKAAGEQQSGSMTTQSIPKTGTGKKK